MLGPLAAIARIYWDAGWRLVSDYGLPLASAATFSGILALFPFLIFVTAMAGFLGGADVADAAVVALFDNLPHEVADAIESEVRLILGERRGDFLTFGILLTFLFSSMGVESLRTALNRAYRIEETRPLWLRLLQNCLFVVLAALGMLLVGLAIVTTPVLRARAVELVPAISAHVRLFSQFGVVIGTLVLVVLLFAMHFWLPAGRRRMGDVWPGILHTMLLWVAAATTYSIYLSHSTYYATTYAGLANIMIAMVFFYVIAAIFVFGAELNRAVMESRSAPRKPARRSLSRKSKQSGANRDR